jgi:hypothetical protein
MEVCLAHCPPFWEIASFNLQTQAGTQLVESGMEVYEPQPANKAPSKQHVHKIAPTLRGLSENWHRWFGIWFVKI